MADHLLVALLVLLNTVEGSSPLKGLYCQDPDTRKLYPINATWPSESFCGNYTCKLRRKNVTETEYTPITKVNITNLIDMEKRIADDMSTSASENSLFIQKVGTKTQPVFHRQILNRKNEIRDDLNKSDADNNDRYLTESEIKTITQILHTVKKSDLDAIVEIYNLAQEIYNEINSTKPEKLLEETMTAAKLNKGKIEIVGKGKNSISYWYDPLNPSNTKTKLVNVYQKDRLTDQKIEETKPVPTVKSFVHPATYFNGPLTEKDFRKLPYYYPMSNFQRMSSYVHAKPTYRAPENKPPELTPCKMKPSTSYPLPWYNPSTRKMTTERVKRPTVMKPMLLPYPFSYINHYNFSSYPASYYYSNYPWAQLNAYNRHKNYEQQMMNKYFSPPPSTEIANNVEELEQKFSEQISDMEDIAEKSSSDEEVKLPEWQTKPLSDKVLEEVKANVLENLKLPKPLPSPTNIKFEKVGKLIKLDETLRVKRDINATDIQNFTSTYLYEPYIEKTICESSLELGIYRMGNLTEPFPACCPTKIES